MLPCPWASRTSIGITRSVPLRARLRRMPGRYTSSIPTARAPGLSGTSAASRSTMSIPSSHIARPKTSALRDTAAWLSRRLCRESRGHQNRRGSLAMQDDVDRERAGRPGRRETIRPSRVENHPVASVTGPRTNRRLSRTFLTGSPPEDRSDETKLSASAGAQSQKERPISPSNSIPTPTSETVVWRPFAAMLLTGLSLPLAYWTRTGVPDVIARARASLPAPAQRPRSIPRESGV